MLRAVIIADRKEYYLNEISDRLRSLQVIDKKYKITKEKRKSLALEIGEFAFKFKKYLKTKGYSKKKINRMLANNFKKDKNRINDYIAAYRVVRKNAKNRGADLSVLIILGQAIKSKSDTKRSLAKKIIKRSRTSKKLKKSNRLEVRRALNTLKEIPEYTYLYKMLNTSIFLKRTTDNLQNEIMSNGLIKNFKEEFRRVSLGVEDICRRTSTILENLRLNIGKTIEVIDDKKKPKYVNEYDGDEAAKILINTKDYWGRDE